MPSSANRPTAEELCEKREKGAELSISLLQRPVYPRPKGRAPVSFYVKLGDQFGFHAGSVSTPSHRCIHYLGLPRRCFSIRFRRAAHPPTGLPQGNLAGESRANGALGARPGGALHIAVDPMGSPWVTNAAERIYSS
jgi:hypothetical protein